MTSSRDSAPETDDRRLPRAVGDARSLLDRLDEAARAGLDEHMTETDAVLWTVVIVVTTADVVLTISGLANGLQEGNVVVRQAIAAMGLPGFWIVKFLALCWLVLGWVLLPGRKGTAFLAVFGLVTMGVVLHNAVLMLAL